MKRYLILASLLFATLSCSKEPVESTTESNNGTMVSLTASLSDVATRVKPDEGNTDEKWHFSWEEGDALSGWYYGCNSVTRFETTVYDPKSSLFSGLVLRDAPYRFIYPYESSQVEGIRYYRLDVSEQNGELSKMYLINDEEISSSDMVDGTVTDLTMKHLGAILVVDVYLENSAAGKTYTLKSIKYKGIPVSAMIDMMDSYDHVRMLNPVMDGTITASNLNVEFETAADDPDYLQAVASINILPFPIKSGDSVSFELEVEISDDGEVVETINPSVTLANEGEDLPFDRATHNFAYLTLDGSYGIKFTGATINDWYPEVKGDLDLSESIYSFDDINSGAVPLSDTWVFGEEVITKEGVASLEYVLYDAVRKQGRSISISLPNATSIEESSFTNDHYLHYAPITAIDIPKVKTIGDKAFYNSYKDLGFMEVTGTENVETIGAMAFFNTGISSFDFKNVKSIGYSAFANCPNLKELKNIDGIEVIAKSVFFEAPITTFDFANVTTIGNDAFNKCRNLVNIPNIGKVSTIGSQAFEGSGITSVDLSNATSIGHKVFNECEDLVEVTNLDKLTVIPEYAFYGCSKLKSIDLVNVETIESHAFYSCNALTEIKFSAALKSIGRYNSFSSVTTVTLNWTGDQIWKYNDYILSFKSGATIYIPAGTMADYQAKGWGSKYTLVEKTE